MNARITVFTFKQGLLSRAAHDLKIAVDSLTLDEQLNATLDARSLRVVCAMKDGREDHGALSSSDRAKIQASINKDVLHTHRFPQIRFTAQERSEHLVVGLLELHGVTREVQLRLHGPEARVRLHQPDYGIRPYSAMMGALQVKPGVEVLIELG